jgi:hypothetical protein
MRWGSWDDPRAGATRGRRRPSLGLVARLGVPVGGRVKKTRSWDHPSHPL